MPKKKSKKKKHEYSGFFLSGKWPENNNAAHGVKYRQPFYSGALAGIALLLVALLPLSALVYFILNKNLQNLWLLLGAVGIFLITFLISYIVRSKARCPLCRGHALLTGKNKKNPKALKIFPFSYAITSCLTILFLRRYRCHHCGTPFVMEDRRPGTKK